MVANVFHQMFSFCANYLRKVPAMRANKFTELERVFTGLGNTPTPGPLKGS